ncbi:MAG: MFS transporter [Acetobacteraceae bacterium]
MKLPAALVPLRNRTFRILWGASVVAWLGTWLQNTGAGWLMTSLAPNPLIVSMVQAATIMPVFLLALPGGALADITDRRLFLLGTQVWTFVAACTLAGLMLAGWMTASWLLLLTFCIGIGTALTAPAWSAIVPELVPRNDLVQAIALNGIGYNLTRAVGPAIAGFLIVLGGSSLAFSLYAVSITAVILALVTWRRSQRFTGMPREHLLSAMRTGVRFVRHNPAVQAAMVRTIAYSLPAAAPWAMLPLFVRQELGLGAGMYGLILGMMGIGGVTSGMLLPIVRARTTRGRTVLLCSALSGMGTAILAISTHWLPAAFGMLLFGLGWTAAYATMQAAAQLACPPWVRARSLAIYQLAQNGALTLGSFGWGWLGARIGMTEALLAAAATGAVLAVGARYFRIEGITPAPVTQAPATAAGPEAAAAELVPLLRSTRGRVMETMHYVVPSADRARFLAIMQEVRRVRGRTGAEFWQLYENVAHPEGWLEIWSMESWTDHLREAARLSEDDRAVLARAASFLSDLRRPARYLSVDPEHDDIAAAAHGRHHPVVSGSDRPG